MPSVHFSFIYIGKEDFTERQEDLFTPQVAARAGAEPIQSRSLFRVSHAGAGSQGFGPSSTAFQATGRELDGKWSSRDMNWLPYGMLARTEDEPVESSHHLFAHFLTGFVAAVFLDLFVDAGG